MVRSVAVAAGPAGSRDRDCRLPGFFSRRPLGRRHGEATTGTGPVGSSWCCSRDPHRCRKARRTSSPGPSGSRRSFGGPAPNRCCTWCGRAWTAWPSFLRCGTPTGTRRPECTASSRRRGRRGGWRWRRIRRRHYTDTDGFHPAPAGTYLAAIVLLARISGFDPLSLPPAIPGAPEVSGTVVRCPPASGGTLADRAAAVPCDSGAGHSHVGP